MQKKKRSFPENNFEISSENIIAYVVAMTEQYENSNGVVSASFDQLVQF